MLGEQRAELFLCLVCDRGRDPLSIATLTQKPVLHGDNGSTLKATTVLPMLNLLGVKPSYSRPRVSDDKAYASYCTSFERSRTGA